MTEPAPTIEEPRVELPYRIVDADNHYYEPRDAFTRYMDLAMLDRAVRPIMDPDGTERIYVGDRMYDYSAPQYDMAPPPGQLRDLFRRISSGELRSFYDDRGFVPVVPEAQSRDARLAFMDREGIEACLLFPSLGVCVEHFMKDDVAQTYANAHAFNRWLNDDWGFAHQERVFAPALLTLLDVEAAVTELDWLLDCGVRAIQLRPGPQGQRSPADPVFDDFWARVNEAELLVTFHQANSGYNELFSVYWSEAANPDAHSQSAFQWACFANDRPIMDTLAALVLHNLFGRFPKIRVASVENGSIWVPYLLKVMDKMFGMARTAPWVGGKPDGRPSEVFRRHVWVAPYHEEDIPSLVTLLGADRVLCGSDYPHAEGLAHPVDFATRLDGLTDEQVRLIMRDNGRALLGLPN
jgi:predicted TIM-barrel fold metal-dependent hydrolase